MVPQVIINGKLYVPENLECLDDCPRCCKEEVEELERPERCYSFGAKAVGLDTCGLLCDPEVRECKECFASIIDHLNDARDVMKDYEKKRLYSIAITEAETACMWAVRAITKKS